MTVVPPEAIALAAVLAVAGVLYGSYRLMARPVDVGARLSAYSEQKPRFDSSSAGPADRASVAERVDRVLVRRGFAEQVARDLVRADLRLTVTEFLFLHVLLAGFGLTVGWFASRQVFGGIFVGTLALFIPRIIVSVRRRQRLQAFNNQLGDTVMLLANSLRSGYSMLQAMEAVSREAPPPTAQEFQRVIREVALGLTPEQALNNLVDRIPSEDLEMMVTAINVQREVGGSLARVLDTIGETIRERVRIQGEIRALTAQQRLSGYIIAVLPVALGGALFFMNPEYMMPLFSNKWVICGPMFLMPIVAGIMIGIGFMLIMRIVDIRV